jgi:hypothetical protein
MYPQHRTNKKGSKKKERTQIQGYLQKNRSGEDKMENIHVIEILNSQTIRVGPD